ncbi:hypothetical protein PHLGIDRAFT_171169 [Phlebiopsis gigantea 11061_1 CR5-6]|uniref:Uncharacterized protein n=1 Tax=Phlebiopsis gigantea (strain 11061_1 CR5-6) TaxID=745531 RepID=A0A0C3S804_PHLG1|nr:hypothetical protein PHLGIDRAFT_171169 [Phlebiopsis gigantea 11061_1 CR5-6]
MSSLTPLRPLTTNDGWQPQSTTPLRILKQRDSPTSETAPPTRMSLPRRNSSSWKHVIEGGRVSKSPFKLLSKSSGIPVPSKTSTPSPVLGMLARKASGEKRPRPMSMSEQAENEHPTRKRRQSQGLQGLANRKPVTKSPFKASNEDEKAESSEGEVEDKDDDVPPPPPPKERFERYQSGRGSPSPHRGSSPARPSLVSRRLHGPRTSSTSKRRRRKTVTFDETCDVMEYEVDEDSGSQPFDWVTDEDNDNDDDDIGDGLRDDHDNEHGELIPADAHAHAAAPVPHVDAEARGPLRVHNADENDESFRAGVAEDSITGLVDSMLHDARPQTPPHDEHALPEDLETEGGVPYGRTHHAERVAAAHQQQSADLVFHEDSVAFPLASAATSTPQHSRPSTPISSVSPGSHIPLGRSTHSERAKAQKEKHVAEVEDDIHMLPPSPSPAKPKKAGDRVHAEGLIPRFSLDVPHRVASPCKCLRSFHLTLYVNCL